MDASWRRCGDASRGPVPVSVSGLVGLGESRRTDRDHEQGDSDQLSHRDTPLLFVVTKTVIAAAQPATNMRTPSPAGFILQNWGASDDKIVKGSEHRHHAVRLLPRKRLAFESKFLAVCDR